MRPSSVDTSDPAWVNRKMLSMNSSTSWFWTSRKYSAIVSAERATRSRVPGGSSIWPNTRAVCPSTPASSISAIRSLPSRVRSPTPANTDTPPWSCATRWIISWMSTVLPTPAPPNRPILPPRTYGVSRSMTLMPVSNICVLDSSWSKAGGRRWIGQRSVISSFSPSARLRTSPMTLKTRPLVTSPTGTLMGAPVSCTWAPRTRPSVGLRAIARTIESPRCCATSSVISRRPPPSPSPWPDRSICVLSALYISGIWSAGNSMSTTGPITRATRPTPGPAACSIETSLAVAVICLSLRSCGAVPRWVCGSGGEGVGARHDLADLLGDLGLAGLVGQARVHAHQVLGVLRGGVHRALAGGQLGRRRLQQAAVDPAAHVHRQERVEHGLRRRLELVERQDLRLAGRLDALHDLEREEPDHARRLRHHVHELREHDVQLRDAALVRRGEERPQHRAADLVGQLGRRRVGGPRPLVRELALPEGVVADGAATRGVQGDLLALALEPLRQPLGLPDGARRVGARHAAVRRDDQHRDPVRVAPLLRQRVRHVGVRRHRRHRAGQRAGVRRGRRHSVARPADARRSDELHRAEDLLQ